MLRMRILSVARCGTPVMTTWPAALAVEGSLRAHYARMFLLEVQGMNYIFSSGSKARWNKPGFLFL